MGNLLGELFGAEVLDIPEDAREAVCEALLQEQYDSINEALADVQEALDGSLGLHLTPQKAPFPLERVQQLAHALIDPTVAAKTIQRRADKPVATVAKSFHDDYIKTNAKLRSRLGFKCYLNRVAAVGCCKWCTDIAGRYVYGDHPDDIFRRHDNCDCTVTFENGRQRQDVWSKRTWDANDPQEVLQNASEPTVLPQDAAESLQNAALSRLTLAGKRDILRVADSSDNFYPVSRSAYEKVSNLGVFDDNRDNLIVTAMREVLKTVENEEPGTEWLALYRYNSVDFIDGILSKPGAGFVDPIECGVPYVSIHNHASGETFSIGDIYQLTDTNCKAVFVVGNNGNCYALSKTDAFDGFGFYEKIMKRRLGFEPYTLPTEHEFIRGCEEYGIKYTESIG